MTKTLIVQYTPRNEMSATKALLDHLRPHLKGSVETVNLATGMPHLLDSPMLAAYAKRNYMGQPLNAEEAKTLAQHDAFTAQLKAADVLIVAYPMYNFSLPAAVKAWFDAVLQKGQTWDFAPTGGYVGLLKGKKALIITTAGGMYGPGSPVAAWEHSVSLTTALLQFMGFSEVEAVRAEGLNMTPEKKDAILGEAKHKLDAIAKRWYS